MSHKTWVMCDQRKKSSTTSQKQTHRFIKVNLRKFSKQLKLMVLLSISGKENEIFFFATNKNSNSWIISNKSPEKVKAVTFPKVTSPSILDEWSIIDISMLTRKKQQTSVIPIPLIPKTPTYTAKKVSKNIDFWLTCFYSKR